MNKYFPIVPFIVLASSASAAIQLNFPDLTVSNFPPTAGSTLDFGLVGTDGSNDIYAQIEAINNYSSQGNSGAADGDIFIRIRQNQTAELSLTLFSDASYTTQYNPGGTFSWTSTFSDIEGTNDANGLAHESLTLLTPGFYTLSTNTLLSISADGSSTTFSGQGLGTAQNPTGNVLNADQSRYAVAFTATDTASIRFNYSTIASTRSMFIDVGNLVFTGPTADYAVGAVPEPKAAALITGAFILSSVLLRRRRR